MARVALPALLVALIVAFLFAVRQVLLPFVLSVALAHFANPALRFFEAHGFRRERAVAALYLLITLPFCGIGYLSVMKLRAEAQRLRAAVERSPGGGGPALGGGTSAQVAARVSPLEAPPGAPMSASPSATDEGLPEGVRERLDKLRELRLGALPIGDRAVDFLLAKGRTLAVDALASAPSLAGSVLGVLLNLFLIPFMSFFIMLSAPHALNALLDVCPGRHVERLLNLLWALDESIGSYVRGIILESAVVSAITLAGLWLVGLQYAVWLSLVTGLANLIPYVGPFAGGVPGVIIAFLQFGPEGVLRVAAVFAVVQFLDNWIVQPVILQKAVDLHPVLVIFALSCGGELGGFAGMLFAIPVACIIRLLLSVGFEWYQAEFSDRPPPPPAAAAYTPIT